jgi:hypothetical protein
MKIHLQEIETRIRELIEIRMLNILPGNKIGLITTQQIASAIYAGIAEKNDNETAPDLFTVILCPEELFHWQDDRILGTLKDTIQTVCREANIKFSAPLTLSVSPDETLSPGEVRVIASYKKATIEHTNTMVRDERLETEDNSIPENAFLIIDGRKVFPLTDPVVNIGRRIENQLSIDDPRVSRTHAQLRSIKSRYMIFDLNSTGGTFINGKRINQTILYPGDVISLAGVNIVFGQDNPLPRPDLKDTGPISSNPLDRKTAIFKSPSNFFKSNK